MVPMQANIATALNSVSMVRIVSVAFWIDLKLVRLE